MALDALRHEIPIFLHAVRTGSKGSLPKLCSTLSVVLSTNPNNLKQQWRRWAPTSNQVSSTGGQKAPKQQQIPSLTVLIFIHRQSVNLGYVGPEIPVGAERLWMFLEQEFKRRQGNVQKRAQASLNTSMQVFADSLIRTLASSEAGEDEYDYELWQTLPDVLEQFAHSLVISMDQHLFFDRAPKKLTPGKRLRETNLKSKNAETTLEITRVAQRRSRIATETESGYKVGAKLMRDSIASIVKPLTEFASVLEGCLDEKGYQDDIGNQPTNK